MQQLSEQGFRLSPQQKRIWSLQQAEQNQPYRTQCAVLIEGPLRAERLRDAISLLVNRQEILRTVFAHPSTLPAPVQIITEQANVELSDADLSGLDKAEQEAAIAGLYQESLREPLDLASGPALNARLLLLSANRHELILSVPSIACDLLGMRNLVNELARCYRQCGEELLEADESEELPQYADLAEAQNELLEAEETRAGCEYWLREQPAGADAGVKASFAPSASRAGTGVEGFAPEVITPRLEVKAWQRVVESSRRYGVSPEVWLLSVWAALIWLSEADAQAAEVEIGVKYDGRSYEEMKPALGLFEKYIPLKSELRGGLSFVELARQVAARSKEISEWQEYFNWQTSARTATENAGPSSGAPEYRALPLAFDFQPLLTLDDVAGLSFSLDRQYVCAEPFKLKLVCVERAGALHAELHFDAGFYGADEVRLLAERFESLLNATIEYAESPIGELSILGEAERRRLLVEWNDTAKQYSADKLIHEYFEEQAERTPDAAALVYEDRKLTYRELNERANQLAHYLQASGVGPEVTVGLLMERSLEMVVSLVAILKAGGAYVPLDPAYPQERIGSILETAQPAVLLTQQRFAHVASQQPTKFICLDSDQETLDVQSILNPSRRTSDDNLAYVIYTSGSTGQPKGVMNSHGGIRNRLLWMQDAYNLTPADRVLQKTPYSFDVSVWEFFWPLMTGAALVIARPGGHQDSAYLARLIAEQGITTIHFVPSMLQVFVGEPGLEKCASLKRVICSGEALPAELQRRFYGRMATAELSNLYGPTEAAVDVSFWACERESEQLTVPIGRPIANIQLYVLDQQMEPSPVGVVGELHIGGCGLARGYLRQPGLTAERFIPNPFNRGEDSRLYRTGDLARFLPDGAIEYVGRADYQVKISGCRIELGEIEAVLSRHADVREAVVLAREDEAGEKRLVAYTVAAEGAGALKIGELRDYLKQSLPEYMIPTALVNLEEMPLTPNGKVDRKGLPAPGAERPELERAYAAPQGEAERRISDVWREALRVEQVGRFDNFFDLGGHSLLMTRMHGQLEAAFGREIPVLDLFRYPTVNALAQFLGSDAAATEVETEARMEQVMTRAERRLQAVRGKRTRN
jgi:amino acid adenylation domain-containing protein